MRVFPSQKEAIAFANGFWDGLGNVGQQPTLRVDGVLLSEYIAEPSTIPAKQGSPRRSTRYVKALSAVRDKTPGAGRERNTAA